MNTITSGIVNWKTTIIGAIISVLTLMQETTDLAKWEDWVFPALILILGIFMRDADKSSEASGIVPLVILGAMLCLMILPSCTPQSYIVNTSPYTEAIQSNPDKVVVAPEHVTEIGGFQANIGGTVVTDYGEFSVDNNGVGADVVVDLRSGK